MFKLRNHILAFALVILLLAASRDSAVAHDAAFHAPVDAAASQLTKQLQADAQLAERLESHSRLMAPDAVRGECVDKINVPGQGPSCLAADGTWLVETANGREIPTHGGDIAAGLVWGYIPTTTDTDNALAAANPSSIACTANPRVPHYRLVYTRPLGAADNSGTIVPAFRTEVYKASAFMQQQATVDAPGVTRKLRVLCSGGVPVVDVVQLAVGGASDDYASIVTALGAAGLTSAAPAQARYLVYHDGIIGPGTWGYGGQAATPTQSTQDPFGAANGVGGVAATYAESIGAPDWLTILHETMHTMGAVQDGAPDSNGTAHCFDDHDVMCYDDGSGPTTVVCAYLELDCSGDTYFNAGTPSGWLTAGWNVGKPMNRFIDAGAQSIDYTLPTAATALTKTASTINSMTLEWSAGLDDVGITSYRFEVASGSGGPFTTHSTGATLSRSIVSLAPATTRHVRVYALDAAGNQSAVLAGSFASDADTVDPVAPATVSSTSVTEGSATLTWTSGTDNDQVTSYRIERQVGAQWQTVTTLPASTTSYGFAQLPFSTTYTYAIRSIDRSGNVSALSTPHSFTTLADTVAPGAPTGLLVSSGFQNGVLRVSYGFGYDASGIAGVQIDVLNTAGVVVATTTSALNSASFQLTPGDTYQVRLRTIDNAGNASGYTYGTITLSVKPPDQQPDCPAGQIGTWPICVTQTPPDTTPPSRVTGLAVVSRTRTSITFKWREGRDNKRLRGYRIYSVPARGAHRQRAAVSPATRISYAATRLRAGTTYRFAVRAYDFAGNLGPVSAVITAQTLE